MGDFMLDQILNKFNITGELVSVDRAGSGNINKTYVVTIDDKEEGQKKYLVQKIVY